MKSIIIGAALVAALAGCASAPNSDAPHGANSVYDDPTYPGSGVHIGIGAGSWGGRGGGGVGIGLGF